MTGRILLSHMLEPVGGLFFLNCNYDVPNYAKSSQFYHKLLLYK